jgi:beta-galactosidase GanA
LPGPWEKFQIGVDYFNHIFRYYKALRRLGINVAFEKPNQYSMTLETADHYKAYVQKGGTLVGAQRMGMKTKTNTMSCETLPGLMTDLFGVEIEEYFGLELYFEVCRSTCPGSI